MAKYDQYHPNYEKLYPGIEIPLEVLAVLEKSDRKMRYIEIDLKTERFIHNPKEKVAAFLPSREDSYERLCEENYAQFISGEDSPEIALIYSEEIQMLRTTLLELDPDEATLIHALFYKGMSERKYAKKMGISQKGVNKRKKKILNKLRVILNSQIL